MTGNIRRKSIYLFLILQLQTLQTARWHCNGSWLCLAESFLIHGAEFSWPLHVRTNDTIVGAYISSVCNRQSYAPRDWILKGRRSQERLMAGLEIDESIWLCCGTISAYMTALGAYHDTNICGPRVWEVINKRYTRSWDAGNRKFNHALFHPCLIPNRC